MTDTAILVSGRSPSGTSSAAGDPHAARVPGADDPRAIVLVEGMSDRIALEALGARLGRDLVADRVAILPTGGVHAIGRFLTRFGPLGSNVTLAGLYDEGEEHVVRRGLEGAGLGADLSRAAMEQLGFYVCSADLEDELVRALGPTRMEQVIDAEGELRSFRTFQKQVAKRGLDHEEQLWRFMWNRKIRYATLLVDALDLACVPRPLACVLAHV